MTTAGVPDSAYWAETWPEIKWICDVMAGLLFQLSATALWLIILFTFPISLPLLCYGEYRSQAKAIRKRADRYRALAEAMGLNPKSREDDKKEL